MHIFKVSDVSDLLLLLQIQPLQPDVSLRLLPPLDVQLVMEELIVDAGGLVSVEVLLAQAHHHVFYEGSLRLGVVNQELVVTRLKVTSEYEQGDRGLIASAGDRCWLVDYERIHNLVFVALMVEDPVPSLEAMLRHVDLLPSHLLPLRVQNLNNALLDHLRLLVVVHEGLSLADAEQAEHVGPHHL